MKHLNGKTENFLISASDPQLDLSSGTAVPVYLLLGIEHLVFGIDHVLFVLILLYLVSGWMNLLKVITSFTVAHSITLALSAFSVVSVSQQPVEALIALSITLLALEALGKGESLIRQQPWLVAFMFGLLHGLGFAGALSEIGLPDESRVMALFLFNVGIEIGQVVIVALALALTAVVMRARPEIPRYWIHAPVFVVGGLSAYWVIDRSLAVLLF